MGTFIHLDMRGYAGVAIPGEKYRVKNNAGETLHAGQLDSTGQIEHPCPAGEYTVEFPEWYAHDFTLFAKIGTGG